MIFSNTVKCMSSGCVLSYNWRGTHSLTGFIVYLHVITDGQHTIGGTLRDLCFSIYSPSPQTGILKCKTTPSVHIPPPATYSSPILVPKPESTSTQIND